MSARQYARGVAAAPMLQPGQALGRYRVEASLGQGGMGEVYQAHDLWLRRRVALKILRPDAGPDAMARMAREARAAASVTHPNLVTIHDVGEIDGLAFIAMELVEGRTLRDLSTSGASLTTRLRWLVQIANGLGAAHRAGLVHRDLKPENVVVTADGTVKILDFGLARASDGTRGASLRHLGTITVEGETLGTTGYMPPEQLRSEAIDGRADQFAWGVTAFELLSGARPWDATSDVELVVRTLTEDARSLAVDGLDDTVAWPPHCELTMRSAEGVLDPHTGDLLAIV